MIVFDENIEEYWINLIQSKGYNYFSIRKEKAGITDYEVI
jgi:hypothetical protein